MISEQSTEDIRSLFDWRRAATRIEHGAPSTPVVANDDLALALQLLSCNSRDRRQFGGLHDAAPMAA